MSVPFDFSNSYHQAVLLVLITLTTALLAVVYQWIFPRKAGIYDLPKFWYMPRRRNPHFSGREKEIMNLHASLLSSGKLAITQARPELASGGIGKTELAVEFAYRVTDEYSLIWWIDAESKYTIESAYRHLAQDLKLLRGKEYDQRSITSHVKEWLEKNEGWLLIFDNAESEEALTQYLPKDAKGRMLFTTHKKDWDVSIAPTFPLDVFTLDEAVDFLLKREGSTERREAEELANETGCMPFSLEQANGYIEREKISIAEYLALYRVKKAERIIHTKSASPGGAIEVACDISLEKMREEGKQLLYLCSFFAPEDIQLDMISDGAEHLPEPLKSVVKDSLKFNTLIANLSSCSLAVTGEGIIFMHTLIQETVRTRMDAKTRKDFAGIAVVLADAAFTYGEYKVETWENAERIIAHALMSAEHAIAEEVALETAIDLINNTGIYFQLTSRCDAAKASIERALSLSGKVFSSDDPDVAVMHDNLGEVLVKMREFENARKSFERALEIAVKAFGEDHPTTKLYRENVASLTS